jgi:predicted DsbA family dithiol-disulfide isomerase
VADVRPIPVTFFTDPYCPWSWAAEPQLRRLQVEFGDRLAITFVIVGLHRAIEAPDAGALALATLDAAAESGMPADARVFLRDPPRSTHPAGLAVHAVAEQGAEAGARYVRRLREAIFVEGRRMDSAPALLDAARESGGLDLERLQIDLGSNAIVERFGADVERGRGIATPAFAFDGGDPVAGQGVPNETSLHTEWPVGRGPHGLPYERVRAAAIAAGAEPLDDAPGVEDALRRFGALATAEVAAACDLPRPRAAAALWNLALEWRVRPQPAPGGELWQAA